MIHIIGTAHISRESVEEVKEKIQEIEPDVVAVELDEARLDGLLNQRDIPVVELIKDKNAFLVMFNILLGFIQRRMGEQVGVNPGAEMLAAIDSAKKLGIPTALIDRDIRVTLKRLLSKMGIFEKLRLIKEILFSFTVSGDELEREIEDVKKEENLDSVLGELEKLSPSIHSVIVKERDAYMAYKLIELEKLYGNVVAVVGAGHKKGINHYLKYPEELPEIDELVKLKKKRFSLSKFLKYSIPAAILLIFLFAFIRGVPIEGSIFLWLLIHMIPTFIAVLLAGGSIYSALVGMAASPLTSLNPLLAAGWFAGYTEARVRNVTVSDVSNMFKITTFRELYRNRAFKVLLVAAAANLASMLGTFISFPTVILPLFKGISSSSAWILVRLWL